ncbi:MAG: N-acetyltransferase [Gemmatimonadetes bacterium]|nr:N-acetyltransferase [Gemmatimonadota bacterium]
MSPPVVVRPITSAGDLERFIALPYDLFRGDPVWVPQLRMDVRTMLSRTKNPFFQHSEAEYFLAERNGEVVGRIAAVHNRAHIDYYKDTTGFFGFFECVDDQVVANALFAAAAAWLTQRNLTVMRGPTSFSTNDECGLLVDGFDTPPTLLNPHNPAYYVPLVERAGFLKAKDMYQYCIAVTDQDTAVPERLLRGAQIVAERNNLTARKLDMKHFKEEVNRIKQIYNSAWDKNWGFVPLTEAEIDHLAKQLKPIVVPDGVVFIEKEGQLVGFAAALPDFNVALKKNPSGKLFPGILKVLWHGRRIKRGRILLLGLLPEYRKTGAEVLLYKWLWEKGYKLGFRWAEAGWILEDNTPMNNGLTHMGFQRHKTLRLYDRAL